MRTTKTQAVAVLAAGIAATALAAPAAAIEGAGQYPHGAEGFYAGALPPPGLYFLGYGIRYDGTLKDADGDTVRLPNGRDIDVSVTAFAPRFVYMTEHTILGANWGMHAILPFQKVELNVGGTHFQDSGLGDITISPLILAWHTPTFHYAVALDVNIPTGSYDRANPASIGQNYWSFEPLAAFTWLPGDGWEVNAKVMYNIKTQNNATNYQSGDELHIDYTVAKEIVPNWRFGIGGYWDYQTTNDEANGVNIDNKRRLFAAGPQIAYQWGSTALIGKWHHEFQSENAFQGERFILKVVTPF